MNKLHRIMLLVSTLIILIGAYLVILSLTDLYKQKTITENSLIEAKAKISVEKRSPPLPTLQKEQDVEFLYQHGDAIGILEIPKLKAELPIIAGTNEDDLEKGVGHYTGTVLPGQSDQILLSGHRDTVFRRLGELAIGDTFRVKMPYGDYSYEIVSSQIVDADDATIIKSTSPNEVLTVSTCYPFSFIGPSPSRYVLSAERQDETKD